MFKSRVALAATLSGNYGIYNGFELLEHEPIPGREEYLNSEKYEIKVRDWNKPGNIKAYIARLNRCAAPTRRCCRPAICAFCQVDDGNVIGFVKESVDQRQCGRRARSRLTGDAAANSGCHFGDVQIGPADAAAVGGDRKPGHRRAPPARVGRRPAAHRSGARSRRAVPLSGVSAACR